MRKVIYGINLTTDGCCDHTKFNGSEEIQDYFAELMKEADLIVYGRKTYQLMVPYWPEIAKISLERNQNKISHKHSMPFTRWFFPDH